MNVVGHKWVFRNKFHANGSGQKLKTRLVDKCFQQTPTVDYFDTFS